MGHHTLLLKATTFHAHPYLGEWTAGKLKNPVIINPRCSPNGTAGRSKETVLISARANDRAIKNKLGDASGEFACKCGPYDLFNKR
jgi:hypothetical protein